MSQQIADGEDFRVTIDRVSEFEDTPGKYACRLRIGVLVSASKQK